MSPHLDKELCEKYPNIMAERHLGVSQTAMCWGFDHGNGWYTILDSAMKLVQDHIDTRKRCGIDIEQVVFEQVKEKFGMLTVYYRGGDDYIDGIMRMAQMMSGCTCEECGAPGYPTTSGWIRTLCDNHHQINPEI